jgi:hypothetical protein
MKVTMKNLIILVAMCALAACSSHTEPTPARIAAPLSDCFVPVPVGNIIGFGVNAQPRNMGSDGHAIDAPLDLLVNDLGANYFRVEVFEGETSFETTNDNADPLTFDWTVYDPIFQSKKFSDLWGYIRKVNQLSSTANVQLAFHGGLPGWFGGATYNGDGRSYTLPQAQEDEWVEAILAVLVYARTRAPEPRPHFDLVSPFNEPEYSPPEGFSFGTTNPQIQEARVVRKLVDRMNAIPELTGIQLVVGDHANVEGMVGDRPTLLADPVIAARLAATSFHRYSDSTVTDWRGSNPPVVLSEFNSTWQSDCVYPTTWAMGLEAAGNVISALQGGVTAALAWSDWDATHIHQGTFQDFGLLATTYQGSSNLCGQYGGAGPSDAVLDAMTYSPKPTYYALRHLMRYVRANAAPITMTASNVDAVGYKNGDGSIAIYGRNTGSSTTSTVTLTMPNPPSYLTPRVSTATSTDVVGAPVPLTNGQGSFTFPALSVFSLLSSSGSGSGGSGGSGGMGGQSGAGATSVAGGGNGGVSGGSSSGMAGQSAGATSGGQGGQSGSSGASSGAGGMSSGGQGGAAAGSAGTAGAGMSGAGGAGAAGMAGAAGSSAGTGGSGGLPGLVAAWEFDEGAGTVTVDASGKGHTGTLVGSPAWSTSGRYGNCLSFSGTGKRVTVPDAPDLHLTTNFTLMGWALPSNTTAYKTILIKEESAGLVYLMYAAPKETWLDFGSGDVNVASASGSLSTTVWSHVAFTYDGATAKEWLNGVVVASSSQTGSVKSSTGLLGIGGHSFWGGEWFAGKLDDVRIYSIALTQAQIQTAMGGGL